MARRTLPLLLALAALSLEATGWAAPAFYALLLAIPLAAARSLELFGELVDLPGRAPGQVLARAEAACAFLALVLVIGAAASRAPEALSPIGQSAVVAAVLFFVAAAAARTVRSGLRTATPAPVRRPRVEADAPASARARAA